MINNIFHPSADLYILDNYFESFLVLWHPQLQMMLQTVFSTTLAHATVVGVYIAKLL
jgi:hypothetical protein